MLRHLPWIADLLVLELVWTQGVAILLLVPGLVAGSIAEEDRRGTMRDLLGTPLSGGSIVLGKLAVRLVQVGAAMAIGLRASCRWRCSGRSTSRSSPAPMRC